MEIPTYYFALREDLKNHKEFLPHKANSKDTGWDVRAAFVDQKPLILKPGQKALIPLGIRGFCPEGWWYELKPRSSTFGKKSLHCLYGTIDQTYEGELLLAVHFIPDITDLGKELTIKFGESLGQLIPKKRYHVAMLEKTNEELDTLFAERDDARGTGGFGSTDK